MNCSRVQESFLDYHAGALPDTAATVVRDHLRTCLSCQKEWSTLQETLLKLDRLPAPTPSLRLRTQFYTMLELHQRELEQPSPFVLMRSRLDRFFAALLPARPVAQAALAGVALAAGLAIGARALRPATPAPAPSTTLATTAVPGAPTTGPATNNSAATTTATANGTAAEAASRAELAALREQVETLTRVVTGSLQAQPTPGADRLRTALAALDDPQADETRVAALLGTIAFDPNTNVRLAALESLYTHADQSLVRAGVLASLSRESSPLVQVAMIDFLAASREPAAGATFAAMSRDPRVHEAVRTAAGRALTQL